MANRVAEIIESTKQENWHYAPSSINPADLPSRGCDAKALLQSRSWEGPEWLKQEPDKCLIYQISEVDEETVNSERKKNVVSSVSCIASNFIDTFTRFSSYYKIVRVLAWIFKFLDNKLDKKKSRCKELTSEEVNFDEKRLLRSIQTENFNALRL